MLRSVASHLSDRVSTELLRVSRYLVVSLTVSKSFVLFFVLRVSGVETLGFAIKCRLRTEWAGLRKGVLCALIDMLL